MEGAGPLSKNLGGRNPVEFVLADRLTDKDAKAYTKYRQKHGPATVTEKGEISRSLAWLLRKNGLVVSLSRAQIPLSLVYQVEYESQHWARYLLNYLYKKITRENLESRSHLLRSLAKELDAARRFHRPPDPKRVRLFQHATMIYARENKVGSRTGRNKVTWNRALDQANSEGKIICPGLL